MLILARIVLGLIAFFAVWRFSYWIHFADINDAGRPFLGRGVRFLTGLAAAGLILAATANIRHGFITSALLGALLLGTTGFVSGFFVLALVAFSLGYDPTMAPMWGFILGPLGFILGGPAGALWWFIQRRKAQH